MRVWPGARVVPRNFDARGPSENMTISHLRSEGSREGRAPSVQTVCMLLHSRGCTSAPSAPGPRTSRIGCEPRTDNLRKQTSAPHRTCAFRGQHNVCLGSTAGDVGRQPAAEPRHLLWRVAAQRRRARDIASELRQAPQTTSNHPHTSSGLPHPLPTAWELSNHGNTGIFPLKSAVRPLPTTRCPDHIIHLALFEVRGP